MSRVLRCIWNIPICGGFCAPTENPEKSSLKHFSNEYTVPAAGVYMKVGPVIEWNPCCIFLGSRGLAWGTRHRKQLMLAAFAVSFFSWFLLIFPMLAVSKNEHIIEAAAWATGISHDDHGGPGPVEVFIGLTARVDKVNCNLAPNQTVCNAMMKQSSADAEDPFVSKGGGIYSRLVEWESNGSCPSVAGPFIKVAVGENSKGAGQPFCQACRKSAGETVTFAVMGAITQIMQMTTDLQRSTRFGDVNCQATMGFLTSVWGCISGVMSLRSFSVNCWRSFPPVHTQFVTINWSGGAAFWCLLVGTVLKLWDALCHILLPTPPARHQKPDKGVTELVDYMMAAHVDGDTSSSSEESSESDV